LADLAVAVPPELTAETDHWAESGASVLYVISDDRVIGGLAVEDEIRPESKEAVDRLHEMGVKVAMITGDSQAVADSVARRLGIDEVAAQVLPGDKADAVRRFQEGGRKVAMVGDGVNDAPALATADVGIAIGAGTDVAVEAGDVVLVRNDPRDVPRIIRLSKASYRKMVQNLWWAAGYNIVASPLAAGVLAHQGFLLHPALAALFMSASTVIVAINAQLLRRAEI
jgi:Cu2+-exporting ATPase